MDAFPAFFPLSGRKVAIAGAGEGAKAKARLFEGSPATLIHLDGEAALDTRSYAGAVLAFIDSDDLAFCEKAAFAARQAGALVNVVDKPQFSDFTTPAVIDRGALVAAIGTGGASPMLASVLRGDIEARVPEGAGRIAALLSQMREEVKEAFPDAAQRRAFLREAITGPVAAAAMDGDMAEARDLLRALMSQSPGLQTGVVWLMDGRGPVDFLTVRAVRALSDADAVAADDGVDPGVMARVRRDAPRLDDRSHSELARRAAKGERVARILARPVEGELVRTLRAAGVAVEILPVATG
jgi:precorrin-2 dehydrogenase/sirohydrochlorin ferrochelatase